MEEDNRWRKRLRSIAKFCIKIEMGSQIKNDWGRGVRPSSMRLLLLWESLVLYFLQNPAVLFRVITLCNGSVCCCSVVSPIIVTEYFIILSACVFVCELRLRCPCCLTGDEWRIASGPLRVQCYTWLWQLRALNSCYASFPWHRAQNIPSVYFEWCMIRKWEQFQTKS